MASPLSVIKIVKYFGVWGGGHRGAPKSYKKMAPPLFVCILICGGFVDQKIYYKIGK